MQEDMEDDQKSEKLVLPSDPTNSPDKDPKVMSRELKSLINSAKESKIINESTLIAHKIRKSRKDLFDTSVPSGSPTIEKKEEKIVQSRPSSANSSSSELSQQKDAKRSMRSQNFEFVIKQKKFLKAVSGKPDWSDDNADMEDNSISKTVDASAKKDRPEMLCPIKVPLDRYGHRVDPFCWRCHREDAPLHCSNCPRSYHQRCLPTTCRGPTAETPWACQECVVSVHAADTSKRSPAMRRLSIHKFCELLKHAIRRMIDVNGSEPFTAPVDPIQFPDYTNYVVNPTDLTKLKDNINKKVYGSTEDFTSDTRWIVHNCIIFNSMQSKLTNVARAIMKACRQEMKDIETCPECYLNANTKQNWFIQVCEHPHILLWAKLKSFPYWPAKGMAVTATGLVDVRFFGAHDRAWVPVRDCFLYSRRDPNLTNKNKKNEIQLAVLEVQQYIHNIKTKFGSFNHAPFKTQYIPSEEENQLKILIPNYNSPEGYKHPNFSTISPPQDKSTLNADSPGSSVAEGDAHDKCSTLTSLNMQPKVLLAYHKVNQSTCQAEEGYDTEDEDLTVEEGNLMESSNEDCVNENFSIIHSDDKEEGNSNHSNDISIDPLYNSSKTLNTSNSTLNDTTGGRQSPLEKPGKRKRRTLSEHSGFFQVSDTKKSKTTPDEGDAIPKPFIMRSRVKSTDSKVMMEYRAAVAKNEISANKNVFTHIIKSVPIVLVKPIDANGKGGASKEQTVTVNKILDNNLETKIIDKQTNQNNVPTPQPVNMLNASVASVPEEALGLAAIKVTNVCSLVKVPSPIRSKSGDSVETKHANTDKILAQSSKYEGLKISRIVSVDSQQTENKLSTSNSVFGTRKPIGPKSQVSKATTPLNLNKTMEKLNSLKKSNTLSINQSKSSPDLIAVKSFAKIINTDACKNGTAEDTHEKNTTEKGSPIIQSAAPFPAMTKDTPKDPDMVVIKEEPMDYDESEQSKSDKNHLLNSLQLKPNEPLSPKSTTANAATATDQTKGKHSPPKIVKTIVKKYKSAAEIRDDNITKALEKSPTAKPNQFVQAQMKTIIRAVNKHNESLNRLQKIAPKQTAGICQIRSISGGKITIGGKSPDKEQVPNINGGFALSEMSASSNNSELIKSNQAVCNPDSRLEPVVSASQININNSATSSPKVTSHVTILGNSSAGMNIVNLQSIPSQGHFIQPPISCSSPIITVPQPRIIAIDNSSISTDKMVTIDSTLNNNRASIIKAATRILTGDISPKSSAASVVASENSSTEPVTTSVATPISTPVIQNTLNAVQMIPSLQSKPSSFLNPFEGAPPDSQAMFPSVLGPQHKWVNDSAAKISDYFRHLMNESLNSLALQGSPEAMIRSLQLQLEKVKWQSHQKLTELKHNTELIIKEMRTSFEGEKMRELNELRLQLEAEKNAVSEAKKKQWCSNCERPSQFYCCWNTSYCGYPCQQTHWPTHMKTCTQPTKETPSNRQQVTTSQLTQINRGKKQVIIARTSVPSMVPQTIQNVQTVTVALNSNNTSASKTNTAFKVVPQATTPQLVHSSHSMDIDQGEAMSPKNGTASVFILGT